MDKFFEFLEILFSLRRRFHCFTVRIMGSDDGGDLNLREREKKSAAEKAKADRKLKKKEWVGGDSKKKKKGRERRRIKRKRWRSAAEETAEREWKWKDDLLLENCRKLKLKLKLKLGNRVSDLEGLILKLGLLILGWIGEEIELCCCLWWIELKSLWGWKRLGLKSEEIQELSFPIWISDFFWCITFN